MFNRSHYEDVLVARVERLAPPEVLEQRYESINQFERLLSGEPGGYVTILKFFLHISREEQRERLLGRLTDPRKSWKSNPQDLEIQHRWDDYPRAYELALNRCQADWAPWHVIPSDRKWVRNALVSRTVRAGLERMRPAVPPPPEGLERLMSELGPAAAPGLE